MAKIEPNLEEPTEEVSVAATLYTNFDESAIEINNVLLPWWPVGIEIN